MEEVIQSSSKKFNKEDEDEEIYEKIEAPKFVDFTVPELPLPDDRFWFCIRVGCDQKHEEIDPDALYKSFVLRVMAARSPNLRLRKALSRQSSSANLKCPLSAPAKRSKPRLSRLRISQKVVDAKVKVHPLSKLNSTPTCKVKEPPIAAKALTTPRYKKGIPNPDPFRSVRNPKTTSALTKNRVVAKALVFNSPKKSEGLKTSLECQTQVTEICSGMKKLEINSQRKVSRNSCKPLRCTQRGPNKSQLPTQKSRIKVEVSVNRKDVETKSLRRLKRKSNTILQKGQGSVRQERADNDSSDMEIDGKSRNGSLDVCSIMGSSKSNERNGNEGHQITVTTYSETDVSSYKHESSLSNSEMELEEKDPPEFQTSNGDGYVSNKVNGHEEKIDLTSEKDSIEKEVPLLQTSKGEVVETNAREDDKENVAASDDDRDSNLSKDHSQGKIHKHEVHENHKRAICIHGKTFKGSSTMDATGSQGGKYKKTKPTNPKPFRLRTDERRILREANLERRHLAPLKEITQVAKFPDRNTHRRHGNEQNEKSHGQGIHENVSQEGNQSGLEKKIKKQQMPIHENVSQEGNQSGLEKKIKKQQMPIHENVSQEGNQSGLEKKIKKVQPQQMRTAYLTTPKCAVEQKNMATTPTESQKKLKDGNEKSAQKLLNQTTANSQLLRRQLVRPQRVAGARKGTISLVSPVRLSIIKENLSTISRPKNANPDKSGPLTTNAGGVAASAGRSSSRGRTTVPKGPNFHRIHTPKSCTKFSS